MGSLGLAVGVDAGLLGFGVSGRSQCRVAAFGVSGLRKLDVFFITISHCAWRHVISVQSDKETKQRKRFNRTTLSVHSVQFLFIGAPKARCSPERRMFETLLLANPDIDTLRHQCSRASTLAKEPAPPHALARLRFLVARLSGLLSRGAWSASRITASCVFTASIFGELAGQLNGIRQLRPHAFWRPCLLVGWRRCGSSCVQIRWLFVRG